MRVILKNHKGALLAGGRFGENRRALKMKCYANEFTREYWRGAADRAQAPDYVAHAPLSSIHAPMTLFGRINGKPCSDQSVLREAEREIVAEVFATKTRGD